MLDDFLSYVDSVAPDVRRRFRPATNTDISALEHLAGRQLPSVYRAFAEIAGGDPGGFWLCYDGNVCVHDVVDYYREVLSADPPMIPPNAVLIAAPGSALESACLDYSMSEEPGVSVVDGSSITHPWSESFRNHLWQSAFVWLELARQPVQVLGQFPQACGLQEALCAVRSVCDSELWFSDRYNVMARAGKSGVRIGVASYRVGQKVGIRLGGPSERRIAGIVAALGSEVGDLERVRRLPP